MMKKYLVVFCALVLVFSMAGFANALSNAGFETGDLTDWTATVPSGGSAKVVTSHEACPWGDPYDPGGTYGPVEGEYFAELKTDGPGSYTTLEQLFTISAGAYIEGWAAFDAWDKYAMGAPEVIDHAYVRIYAQSGGLIDTPWSMCADENEYLNTPWMRWTWAATVSGTYILRVGVANGFNGNVSDSYALFDAHAVVSDAVIPEPGTLLLFGAGLIGLLALGRKKLVKK